MSFFSNEQKLDEKRNSTIETILKNLPDGKTLYKCKACGKEATNCDLKKHIEANHLEGIVIPCNVCFKTFETFESRNAKDQHSRVDHKR